VLDGVIGPVALARRAVLLLLAPLLVASFAVSVALAPSSSAVDVGGDDDADLYRGTGGQVWSAPDWRGDEGGRQRAASCAGCEWRITSYCTRLEFDAGGCNGSHDGCPAGMLRVRVWLRETPGIWQQVGTACLGDRPPVTVEEIGGAVRGDAVALLPVLRAGAQPADGALVGLPTVFRTGQPAAGLVGADLSVLGLDVVLDAQARWLWSWGDGSAEWTSRPGGRYPDLSVAHTFRRAGSADVEVVAVWRAVFSVEGLGPFEVPGDPLTQDGRLRVEVREARAVLVG
jgi:hypothetical protein